MNNRQVTLQIRAEIEVATEALRRAMKIAAEAGVYFKFTPPGATGEYTELCYTSTGGWVQSDGSCNFGDFEIGKPGESWDSSDCE